MWYTCDCHDSSLQGERTEMSEQPASSRIPWIMRPPGPMTRPILLIGTCMQIGPTRIQSPAIGIKFHFVLDQCLVVLHQIWIWLRFRRPFKQDMHDWICQLHWFHNSVNSGMERTDIWRMRGV